jgi:cellulose synthase/poly-beta-1,6-N-acetylglucosamine synthase-like glycosyltransferase
MSIPTQKLCSVLLCTYNRADLLQQTLESLCHQTLDKNLFEVIIVDDGSQDSTRETALLYKSRLPLLYAYQRNSGLASARNHALFLSKGHLVLLHDDDDSATPSLLEEHVRSHQLHPDDNFGVLGYTTLAPDLACDPVMLFVTEVGKFLFSYSDIKCGQVLDFTYLWGGRSSCKRQFLMEHGIFNSKFKFGCEDIELAYRLSKHGLRVIYNSRAITTMLRPITYDQFCERLIRQGQSNFVFSQLHPESEVRAWTEVDDLYKWPLLELVYDTMRKSGRDVDAIYRTKQKLGIDTTDDRELLHEAYWTAFRASKIKGIANAAKEAGFLPAQARIAL